MSNYSSFIKRKFNVQEMVEKMSTNEKKYHRVEDECYYPVIDKQTETADVTIRFLPGKDESDAPYVIRYSHMFKGDNGKWFIMDVCPTSNGNKCPVCEINSKMWSTEEPKKQEIVRQRKRRKNYFFNVLVVKDSEQPEKEGKVFPFMCGAQIFNMIVESMKPQFGEEPKNPFDLFEGNNFHLRIMRDASSKQITYKKSKFDEKKTAIFDGDEAKLEEVYNSMIDLKKFIKGSEQDYTKRIKDAYSVCFPEGFRAETVVRQPEAPEEDEEEVDIQQEIQKSTKKTADTTDDIESELEFFEKLAK